MQPVETCKHGKYKYIGTQKYPGNSKLDLKLYNCVYCGATFSSKTLIKLNKQLA